MKKENMFRKVASRISVITLLAFGLSFFTSCSDEIEVKNVYTVDFDDAMGWYGCDCSGYVKYYIDDPNNITTENPHFFINLTRQGDGVRAVCYWQGMLGGYCYKPNMVAEFEDFLVYQPIYHVEKLVGNSVEIMMQSLQLKHEFASPLKVKNPWGPGFINVCEIYIHATKSPIVIPVSEAVFEGEYSGQAYSFEKIFYSKEEYDEAAKVDYVNSIEDWSESNFEVSVSIGDTKEDGDVVTMVGSNGSIIEGKGRYDFSARSLSCGKVTIGADDVTAEYPKTVTKKWDDDLGRGVISGYGFKAVKVSE